MKDFILKPYDFDRILTGDCHIDRHGNWHVCHQDLHNTISIYNFQFEHLSNIDISDVLEEANKKFPHSLRPAVTYIYRTSDNNIILSLSHCRVCTVSADGTLLHLISTTTSNAPNQYTCRFSELPNNQILLSIKTGFQGDLLAISKDPIQSFRTDTAIEWMFLTDTIAFPEDYFPNVINLDLTHYNRTNTIGSTLVKIAQNYNLNKDPLKAYWNHSMHHKIAQTIRLHNGNLVILSLSDASSRSRTPDKNMPYYFFHIDRNTGHITNSYAPDDRSIHKWNYYGKIVSFGDLFIYKTYSSLLLFDQNFEQIESIALDRKLASLRELSPIAQYNSHIYWANQKMKVLYQTTIDEQMSVDEYITHFAHEIRLTKK